jgi:predicted transposase/invertase (TIGR01784 family)
MAIMKNSMDRASDIGNARMEGETKGMEQGEIKKNLENAKKMKEIGISVEKIQAVTGLSAETIESL